MIEKPMKGDYPAYFENYVEKVDTVDILSYLRLQKIEFSSFLKSKVIYKRMFAYDTGKWTCQELLGHLIDAERVMLNRAFFISRNDPQNLPGFEQDDYVAAGRFMERDFEEMIIEFETTRENSLQLLKTFRKEDYFKKGIINGFQTVLAAIPYIMFGHVAHHQEIIEQKYLK